MTTFAAINSADPQRRQNGPETTFVRSLKLSESLDYKRSAAGIVSVPPPLPLFYRRARADAYSMNCSLPTKPMRIMPLRWAIASTLATVS